MLARRTIVAEPQREFRAFGQASYFGAGVKHGHVHGATDEFGLDQRLTGVEGNMVKGVLA
jgi:hypothetical protein